jgi:hypothetical protein
MNIDKYSFKASSSSDQGQESKIGFHELREFAKKLQLCDSRAPNVLKGLPIGACIAFKKLLEARAKSKGA